MSWKPPNWEEIKRKHYLDYPASREDPLAVEALECGADAILPEVMKWLKQYHTSTYHNLDRHNKPAPELEFVIPERVLKEMEVK